MQPAPDTRDALSRGRRWTVAAVALLSAGLLFAATQRQGVGVSTDSVSYLRAAENIARSGRATTGAPDGPLLTQWPPGYPALLALPVAAGLAPETAARLLGCLLLAANLCLFGALLGRVRRRGVWLAVFALGAVHRTVFHVHGMAWSEGPFLFFVLLSLWLLDRGRRGSLLVSGLAAALSGLVRYAGLALVVGHGWVLLGLERGRGSAAGADTPVRRRWWRAALYVVGAALPLAGWMLLVRLSGSGAPRRLGVYPLDAFSLHESWSALAGWWIPSASPEPVRVASVLGLLALLAWLLRLPAPKRDARVRAALAFVACSLGMLALSRLFLDPKINLLPRFLLPLFWMLLLWLAHRLDAGWEHASRRLRRVLLGCLFLLLLFNGARSAKLLLRWHAEGQGFATRTLQASPFLATLRDELATLPVYGEPPQAVRYLLGREVRRTRAIESGAALEEDARVVVLFGLRRETAAERRRLEGLGLRVLRQDAVGVVLGR